MRKGLYILLAILLLIVGCDTKTAIKTGEICVNVDGRSVDPISMETSYYSISVTSGNNIQRAPKVEKRSFPARFNVDKGDWTVVVDAYNNHGDRIGTGSEKVTVFGGESSPCNVTVNEIEGTGTLILNVNLTLNREGDIDSTFYSKNLLIVAKDEKDTITLHRGPFNTSSTNSPIVSDFSNGRYFIEVYDDDTKELLSDPIPLRIVTGASTIINFEYRYDKDFGWSYIPKEPESFCPNSNYHIELESEEVPIDCELRGTIECDYGYNTSYSCSWYLNGYQIYSGQNLNFDLSNQYYREQCGIKVGGTYMLSVKVTDGYPGKDSENNVDVIFYDYKLITILEKTGLPESIEVLGLPDKNEEGSRVILSSNPLSLSSYAVNDGISGSSIAGNWYINDVCVAENTDKLSFDSLEGLVGRNDVKFECSLNGYTRTYYITCFYVKPEMELVISLDGLKAGKSADISVDKVSGQYDGDYSLNLYLYEYVDETKKVLSSTPSATLFYYNGNTVSVNGNYPSKAGKYGVKYAIMIDSWLFSQEEDLFDIDIEEPDFALDSKYGNKIIQGGLAEFIVNYPCDGNLTWYLDGKEIRYNGNSLSLYIDRVEWKVGNHTIKAIDGNGIAYSYDFEVLPAEKGIEFDLDVVNLGDYKYEVKVVPSDVVGTEFTYSSTVYINGIKTLVFELSDNEKTVVDRKNDDNNDDSFSYEIVTTYFIEDEEITVVKYGYYKGEDSYSSNKLSFDKLLYVGDENIIVDIKLESGYEPSKYKYSFLLDGNPIDIDFEGEGEYLLPKVSERMHSFEMDIKYDEYSSSSYSAMFMYSENGFTPMPANEIYLSLGTEYKFIEGSESLDFLTAKYCTLVLSDDGYCYFCIIKAGDSSDPILMTIPCQYTIDQETGDYIFNVPGDEGPTVFVKNGDELRFSSGNKVLSYSFHKFSSNEDCKNSYVGNWELLVPEFSDRLINGLIKKYLPEVPVSVTEENGEGLEVSLQFSITEEWINAYLDVKVDATALDVSLAKDTTIHLEGKIEYEEDNGYLSFMDSRYPVYLQLSKDGRILLLHIALPGCPEGTPFLVLPLVKNGIIDNPISNVGEKTFDKTRRITIEGVEEALSLLCEKQLPSSLLTSMMMRPVSINNEFSIEPGKYSVECSDTGDESIMKVLGKELLVVNGNLCFVSDNSMREVIVNIVNKDGLVEREFISYDEYGISCYYITNPEYITEDKLVLDIKYSKQGLPYKNGTITLTRNKEVSDIAIVQEYIGDLMKFNVGNDPDDIYIEFDTKGDIYYKFGDDFSYMVAHYVVNDERIAIFADASDIAAIMNQEVDGWGARLGIVLPYNSVENQITLIDDVFVKLYPVL